jgi:hypothetical protein
MQTHQQDTELVEVNVDVEDGAEKLTEESLTKVTGGRMIPEWKSDGAQYRDGRWQGGTAKGARERANYARGGKTRGIGN